MPTKYLHRLHLVIPAARVAAANTWLRANIDTTGGDWFRANLSATGEAPFTHAQASAALTDSQAKSLLAYLAGLASQSLPANWDARTRAQKQAAIAGARDAINTTAGVYLTLSDNDGAWPDLAAALQAKSVRAASEAVSVEAKAVAK